MALGNANTTAQARGKNKATKIKKRKEVVAAASYTEFNAGPVAADHATACAGAATGNTFYHDGTALIPTADDIVYKTKRARNPNSFTAGFYKLAVGAKGFATMSVNSSGVCTARTNCV